MTEALRWAPTLATPGLLLLAALAGAVLGAFFFGGLWWTTQRAATSPSPALWFVASLLVRMAVVLPALLWLAAGQWERLLASLLGFMLARVLVTRLTRPPVTRPASSITAQVAKSAARKQRLGHAP